MRGIWGVKGKCASPCDVSAHADHGTGRLLKRRGYDVVPHEYAGYNGQSSADSFGI